MSLVPSLPERLEITVSVFRDSPREPGLFERILHEVMNECQQATVEDPTALDHLDTIMVVVPIKDGNLGIRLRRADHSG